MAARPQPLEASGSEEELDFDSFFSRFQANQAVKADRGAKAISALMWLVAAAKFSVHGAHRESALSLACALCSLSLLAYSLARRCCYVRRARWLTAIALLQAHGTASFVCLRGYQMISGRHSVNVLRFFFIVGLNNTGLFQALAALNSWPLMGTKWLVWVQLVSVAVMVPRMSGQCEITMATDDGAQQLFTGVSWLLRLVLSPVDPGPLWAPVDSAMHNADCLIVHTWWLLLCGAASAYISWLSEQRARERLARQLGPAGAPALRALLHRNPLYTHQRPALLIAIEIWLLAALIWEALCAILLPVAPDALPA